MTFIAALWQYIRFYLDTIIHSGAPALFFIRPRWTDAQIPDMYGKVVIVTGGNSGTGYATCKALYEHGATIYMASRSEKRAEEAIAAIRAGAKTGMTGFGQLIYLNLDLSDLDSVERFCSEFVARETKLDLLFANAGVMASPAGLYTKQGYTLQFGTNCLGHHRLITLLLPLLLETSRANPSQPPRVIVSSSVGHIGAPPGGVKYESVVRDHSGVDQTDAGEQVKNPVPGKNELPIWVEYGQSKWGSIALAKWLHWHHGPGKMLIFAGSVATNLAQHLSLTPVILRRAPWAVPLLTWTAVDGASNQLWVATCDTEEARKLSGAYVVPFQHVGRARPDLDDRLKLEQLWDWCDAQAKRHV
ncbi:hypothetical protein M231_03374 [Tremella mesenterica]|uniref:NAD(P)-binding protein n=1 Tax=Tremella mesenterica TaxID=5217 RepID=A0A4Q1BN56_TREME|nr:hypothetical protein M231_03374 [Tremella mesenterica]